MTKTRATTISIDDVRGALKSGKSFDELLAAIGQRDRTNIERHLAVIDAEPDEWHGRTWRRLAAALANLAPLSLQTNGQQAVQFFIADGKYRMQVFALEDLRDGHVRVYAPDSIADAVKAHLVHEQKGAPVPAAAASTPGNGGKPPKPQFRFAGMPLPGLLIEQLDAKNTANPAPYFANLIGWNRKALRISIPVGADDAAIDAVVTLCAFGAIRVAGNALPAVAPANKPAAPAGEKK